MPHYKKVIGDFGEGVAKKYLMAKGYRIIDANLKLSYREIDIIALLGDVLVFVEVKTRSSKDFGAADALNNLKINRMKKAAGQYLSQFKGVKFNRVRLDFLAIDLSRENKTAKIKHFLDII